MGIALLFIVLAVLIVGGYVLMWYLRRAATRALNRHVLNRGGHEQGKAATTERLSFTAPVPAPELAERVIAAARPAAELPGAFVASLVVLSRDPDGVTFGFGNKLRISWRSRLTLTPVDASSTSVDYRVLNWTLANGIVAGLTEMQLLANTVRGIAADLGSALGNVRPAGAAPSAAPEHRGSPLAPPPPPPGVSSATTAGASVLAPPPPPPASAAPAAPPASTLSDLTAAATTAAAAAATGPSVVEPSDTRVCPTCGSRTRGRAYCTSCGTALAV